MAELKDAWIKTAKSFVLATNDLVSAVAQSAKAGRDKVVNWAESESGSGSDGSTVNTEGTEIPTEDNAEPVDAKPADDKAE